MIGHCYVQDVLGEGLRKDLVGSAGIVVHKLSSTRVAVSSNANGKDIERFSCLLMQLISLVVWWSYVRT